MIDREEARDIAEDVKAEVTEIFKKYGLSAPKMRTTYGGSIRITLEATKVVIGEGGVNMESEEAQYYTLSGFAAVRAGSVEKLTAPLGTKFVSSGKEYIFAGIAARRRKYPIYCLDANTREAILFTDSAISKINAAATESADA